MDSNNDILWRKFPGTSTSSILLRFYFRFIIVSELNKKASLLLRSHAEIQSEKKRNLYEFKGVIHPYSDARILWEIVMAIVYNIYFWTYPFNICYALKLEDCCLGCAILYYILLVFICIDIILNFNTGYVKESSKEIVLNRWDITRRYLKTYFIIDAFTIFPVIPGIQRLPLDKPIKKYIRLVQLVGFVTYLRLPTSLQYKRNIFEEFQFRPYAQVIYALYLYITFSHFITCVYYAINFFYELEYDIHMPTFLPSNQTWVIKNQGVNGLWSDYIQSYYTATLLITLSSTMEQYQNFLLYYYFSILVWVLAELMFIYYVVILTQVQKGVTSSESKYHEMVRQLREYIRHKQFPKTPQTRLLQYYEFRFQKSYFREYEILNSISGQLRQEIVLHSCRQLVENVAFFERLPLSLLVRIVSCLRSEVYLMNDIVIRANMPGDAMYFIASGTVAVFTNNGREICHLEDGAHFGEIALVMAEAKRIASVIAIENCELYKLSRKDFKRAIQPYPELLERIEQIASERFEKAKIYDAQSKECIDDN